MRRVLLFVLIVAVALGGLGFAHAAVTDSQDDLLIYHTEELGDSSALSGLRVSMTFACTDHLRWHTTYTFGGEAQTDFEYRRKAFPQPAYDLGSSFDMWFTGGLSTSTNGSISIRAGEYGSLIRAVADGTPDGESRTESLRLKDYVNYYMPDYQLSYQNGEIYCREGCSLFSLISGEGWHGDEGCYHAFLQKFRFPVQEEQTISVTVDKSHTGGISSLSLSPDNGPQLFFISDVTAEGIWFIPVFRDEAGDPLPYESPQGHGIYFAPWRKNGTTILSGDAATEGVTPDLSKLRLVYPLPEELRIESIRMDGGEAWLLTRDSASYTLSACDLTTGETTVSLSVLPYDPNGGGGAGSFVRDDDLILVTAQNRLALVDPAAGWLLLTAPDTGHSYGAHDFDPDTGDLRYDGTQLTLIDACRYYDSAFWSAAYAQDELRCLVVCDCSLMSGNDTAYRSLITLDQDPIRFQ